MLGINPRHGLPLAKGELVEFAELHRSLFYIQDWVTRFNEGYLLLKQQTPGAYKLLLKSEAGEYFQIGWLEESSHAQRWLEGFVGKSRLFAAKNVNSETGKETVKLYWSN